MTDDRAFYSACLSVFAAELGHEFHGLGGSLHGAVEFGAGVDQFEQFRRGFACPVLVGGADDSRVQAVLHRLGDVGTTDSDVTRGQAPHAVADGDELPSSRALCLSLHAWRYQPLK